MSGLPLCLLLALLLPAASLASVGDNSYFNEECMDECVNANCSSVEDLKTFERKQPWCEKMLRWSCKHECRYQCMWQTVVNFRSEDLRLPQFRGKWPFARVCGVEEPASAAFSLCNLAVHLVMQSEYRARVGPGAPMRTVWTVYGAVSAHAWAWSAAFHTRDFKLTERMDYVCAFSVVLSFLVGFFIRLFGSDWNARSVVSVAVCALLFAFHVWYMTCVKWDYGYNMRVNLSVGASHCVLWLAWAAANVDRRPAAAKWCAAASAGLAASALLEVADIPPSEATLWSLDSHALFHAATVPIGVAWYRFVIEDGVAWTREEQEREGRRRRGGGGGTATAHDGFYFKKLT